MNKKCPLVLIEWLDSAQPAPGWVHLHSLPDSRPIECMSVGWLLRDDKKVKVLAPNMGDTGSGENIQASGIITIPACAVKKITRLRETG